MSRLFLLLALVLAACDAGFDGALTDNQPPDTELSVRVGDLSETLGGRRLLSTVDVSWSGTDGDGVVTSYEVRAYAVGAGQPTPGPEDGWGRTTRRDSTLLLPIPLGEAVADVAVEVRARDDDGAVDPSPARTVFPILNSPPTLRLVEAETPPDTTWPIFSFAFDAADRDGEANLAGIEIALNNPDGEFVRLPADVTFLTLVAENPGATGPTGAQLFLGRGFSNSGLVLPGLLLDEENEVYVRAVDQAGAASSTVRFPGLDEGGQPLGSLYVRRVTSRVLLVNDFRGSGGESVMTVARNALALNGTSGYDEWDLSMTPQSAAAPRFSEALPGTADPTLRETLALWDRIYWVSNAVTNRVSGNNLPRAASVMAQFFEQGGRMLVHTPVSLPATADDGAGNPAIDILPLGGLIEFPPGSRALRADAGTPVRPGSEVPGTGRTLPPLQAAARLTGTLPYIPRPDDITLYSLSFYKDNRPQDLWEGSEVVASIRADRRVGLFALPLFTGGGTPLFEPGDGGTEGPTEALALLLEGLDFPTSAGRLARR